METGKLRWATYRFDPYDRHNLLHLCRATNDKDYSTGEWEMCCCTGGLAAETPDASDWQFALVVPISIGIKIDGGRKLNCLIT